MKYINEMRVSHYLKNVLILCSLAFGGKILNIQLLYITFIGFLSFSFMCSVVYIINDIKDVDKDRMHKDKKLRPIASGDIQIAKAKGFAIILFLLSVVLTLYLVKKCKNWNILSVLILYLIINLLYSVAGLKKVPLLDVVLLTLGFYLRVLYGSELADIPISSWLYMVVITSAFYMGMGKRRNEWEPNKDVTRDVLSEYNVSFLNNSMNCCLTMAIVFFSLWCMEMNEKSPNKNFLILVPLLIIICFKYSMNIENSSSSGDPMNVILTDKVLLVLGTVFTVAVIILIYL